MYIRSNGGSSGGSQTSVIEMHQPEAAATKGKGDHLSLHEHSQTLRTPPPATAVAVLEQWNRPRINMYRTFATFYSFIILGMNDAAYGALIPYLEEYYDISYIIISLVFLSPAMGYISSACTNNLIHTHFGQRGIAAISSISHLIAYIVIAVHPPYPVLVIVFILAGYGNGLADSGWNAWIGDMAHANEVLGFLHASYGLGGAIAPLVATTLVTKAGWMWYEFYYIMIGLAFIEVIFAISVFWRANGAAYRNQHRQLKQAESATTPEDGLATPQEAEEQVQPSPKPKGGLFRLSSATRASSPTAEAVMNRITWLCSLFLLIYVGTEVAIGGWVVTFMLRVRHAQPFAAGLTSTGFWLGITVGRMVLGFVTARVFPTEKVAITVYLIISVGLELLFWLVQDFISSAVMVALLGFFLAPMFPAAVVAETKLLPKRLHVAAVGFAAAFGASGACVFPFAVGAIAQAKGVGVLQPIVLALLAVLLGVWWLIPKLPKIREA